MWISWPLGSRQLVIPTDGEVLSWLVIGAPFTSPWLVIGAPLGIEEKFLDQPIFPEVESEPLEHAVESTDWASFTNYSSVEDDEHAMAEIERLVKVGYIQTFTDLDECRASVQGEPVLSKLGLISKDIIRADGHIKTKRRLIIIILDCRRSTVNDAAHQKQRIVLPTARDVVHDLLALLDNRKQAETVQML
eukprot:3060600-Amphidinium_carterae.1